MKNTRAKNAYVAGMLLSFLSVTAFSLIYMAKDNNFNNMIFRYFNISKTFYSRLIYLDIHKDTLICGMNLCSLTFLFCNCALSLTDYQRAALKRRKKLLPFLICFLSLQAIVFSPWLHRFLYNGGAGFLPNPAPFRHFYTLFHKITVTGNLLLLGISLSALVHAAFKKEPVRELKYIKWSLAVIDLCICSLYFYMYFSLPDSFLWISRAVGYTTYRSLTMAPWLPIMKLVPWLTVCFIGIYWFNLYRYDKTLRRLKNEDYVFSSIVASSEISTRVFSHYVKNELLGIISETEWIMKAPAERADSLTVIRDSCAQVYERLNDLQKNSNRIVLNQSSHNIFALISQAVESNESIFRQNKVQVIYEPDRAYTCVFCDPYYLKEVFTNLFSNSLEAMAAVSGPEKIIRVRTTCYEARIKIVISDTGPGISLSILDQLFDPFVSTKSTRYNWGIGLSFSKRIINNHNGKIEAGNLPEGGAEFTVYLPLIDGADSQDPKAAPEKQPEETAARKLKIKGGNISETK